MSPTPATRILLRQSNLVIRRNAFRQASTASEAAGKAQESGQKAISKASEGLSRVTSSAGSAVSRAGAALGKVGGRTGRLIAFVECTPKDIGDRVAVTPANNFACSINTTYGLLLSRRLGAVQDCRSGSTLGTSVRLSCAIPFHY